MVDEEPSEWSRAPRPRIRRVSAMVLAVLGCLLSVVALVAVWGRNQVLDTDRYLATVEPLASDPVIQDEVSAKVSAAILQRLDRGRATPS